MRIPTERFRYRNLPHWEVTAGTYFITVRCARSLPTEVLERLRDIDRTIAAIRPHSSAFAARQRQYFLTTEKYLDAEQVGPLSLRPNADIVVAELNQLQDLDVSAVHYTVMPNHWHAILKTADTSPSLSVIMKRLKGRTARQIRKSSGTAGPVWQREWFDHWTRDEAELERCIAYIRHNPVKAGIVTKWSDHAWTR